MGNQDNDTGQQPAAADLGAFGGQPQANSFYEKAADLLSNGVGLLCGLAILAMVLVISYEVVARYLFNEPTSWVSEYSLYLFVGASRAKRSGCTTSRPPP